MPDTMLAAVTAGADPRAEAWRRAPRKPLADERRSSSATTSACTCPLSARAANVASGGRESGPHHVRLRRPLPRSPNAKAHPGSSNRSRRYGSRCRCGARRLARHAMPPSEFEALQIASRPNGTCSSGSVPNCDERNLLPSCDKPKFVPWPRLSDLLATGHETGVRRRRRALRATCVPNRITAFRQESETRRLLRGRRQHRSIRRRSVLRLVAASMKPTARRRPKRRRPPSHRPGRQAD
jgi:hypothetical protein